MSRPVHSPSPNASLDALRERIRRIEGLARHGVLPFGVPAIDEVLPGGGLALGGVHEVAGAGSDEEDGAAAAGFIAGILARLGPGPMPTSPSHRSAMGPSLSALGEGWGEVGDSRAPASGPVLWCLKQPDLYGPGLLGHGIDPTRLVLVAARRDDEVLWAVEEGLRAGPESGLAAVVAEIGRLPMVASRRLQLAAERSGVTALLLRRWRSGAEAAAERERPSAALTRWRIAALLSTPRFASSAAKLLPLLPLATPTLHSPASGGGLGRGLAGNAVRGDGARNGWGLGIGRPRWRVELLRCRGGVPGSWDVEVADATGHVSLSAGLADRPAAPSERQADRLRAEPLVRRAG